MLYACNKTWLLPNWLIIFQKIITACDEVQKTSHQFHKRMLRSRFTTSIRALLCITTMVVYRKGLSWGNPCLPSGFKLWLCELLIWPARSLVFWSQRLRPFPNLFRPNKASRSTITIVRRRAELFFRLFCTSMNPHPNPINCFQRARNASEPEDSGGCTPI